MKKILAISCPKIKRVSGGTERYVLDLIRGFSESRNNICIYSSGFDNSLNEFHQIKLKKVKLSFIPKKLRPLFLSNQVNKLKSYDEFLISTNHVISDLLICGGNHIGYLHSLNKSPSIMDRIKIYSEKKAFLQSRCIICHSNLMKKELIQFYSVPENHIKTIYPPVDTSRFYCVTELERKKLREKFGFNDNEVIYLFPSTGHFRKGLDILQEVFNQLDLPIKLVVAGSPVKDSKNIKYLGFCSNMPELYRAADFTIMASKYEPFGLVGIESILSGTPIIFSNNMGCLEVLTGNFGYTFEQGNERELYDIVVKSLEEHKQGKTRVANPQNVLLYNPSLEQHILDLQSIISILEE